MRAENGQYEIWRCLGGHCLLDRFRRDLRTVAAIVALGMDIAFRFYSLVHLVLVGSVASINPLWRIGRISSLKLPKWQIHRS